jgi:hypothetical protein
LCDVCVEVCVCCVYVQWSGEEWKELDLYMISVYAFEYAKIKQSVCLSVRLLTRQPVSVCVSGIKKLFSNPTYAYSTKNFYMPIHNTWLWIVSLLI